TRGSSAPWGISARCRSSPTGCIGSFTPAIATGTSGCTSASDAMPTPLVSILIPCYNGAPWLAATLESALTQTWRNTEVILVDDGSTDDSRAIAQGFAPRGVQLIAQPNAGDSAARNRALRAARGDYFQFLDADDLLSPGKLAAQLDLLAYREPGTVASCAWGRFTTDPAGAHFVDRPV